MHFTYSSTHLFVSPHQVGLGVTGVMDHHLLLPHAALTATRGAADGVVMEEYYSEDDGKDVCGHSKNKESPVPSRVCFSVNIKCLL